MQLFRVSIWVICWLGGILSGAATLSGQSLSRSGFPAPAEDKSTFRRFPCGGLTLLDEKFDGDSIPAGWSVYDVDNKTPRAEIQFLVPHGGWQSISDPKDTSSTNRVFASPSWYTDSTGASDDWLVLPPLGDIPANVCLSWYAYSQDIGYPEAYEVIVSTTGGTPADLANGDTLLFVDEESQDFTFRSVNLSEYAGSDVWIAFHHSSVDKFLLVLDDIRLAEVEETDLGTFLLDPISAPKNSEITLSGALINRGITEIEFDSAELKIAYRIDDGDTLIYDYPKDETLVPNDTIQFAHDSVWTPTEDAVYLIKIWFESMPGDINQANDTLYKWQGIGAKTAITNRAIPGLRVWYEAIGQQIRLNEWPGAGYNWTLRDINGRRIEGGHPLQGIRLDMPVLSPGIYLWTLENGLGIQHTAKIQIRQ